jgi:hypothetical protein
VLQALKVLFFVCVSSAHCHVRPIVLQLITKPHTKNTHTALCFHQSSQIVAVLHYLSRICDRVRTDSQQHNKCAKIL